LFQNLSAGSYYVQVDPADIAKSGETVNGSLTVTVVPEPASWTMMILGLGGLGATLRGRRKLAAA
jgi:hypothetical protein